MSQPEPDQEWRPSLREPQDAQDPRSSGEEQDGSVRYDPSPEPAAAQGRPYGSYEQTYGPYGPAAPAPAGGAPRASTSTIVLLVVSCFLLLVTFWTAVGLLWAGPAVLAVVALTRASADPAGAGRLTRIGWWVTAGLGVLTVLLVVVVVVALVVLLPAATSTGYDSSTVGLTTSLQALAVVARP